MAAQLRAVPAPSIRPEFRGEARDRIIAHARRTPRSSASPLRGRWLRTRTALVYLGRGLAAALALTLAAAGTAGVSASSMPGEVLYPTKLAVEQVQLAVISGESRRIELRLAFAERRLEEIDAAARAGDHAAVAELAWRYESELESIVAASRQTEAPIDDLLRKHFERGTVVIEEALAIVPPPAAAPLRKSAETIARTIAGPTNAAAKPQSPAAEEHRGATGATQPQLVPSPVQSRVGNDAGGGDQGDEGRRATPTSRHAARDLTDLETEVRVVQRAQVRTVRAQAEEAETLSIGAVASGADAEKPPRRPDASANGRSSEAPGSALEPKSAVGTPARSSDLTEKTPRPIAKAVERIGQHAPSAAGDAESFPEPRQPEPQTFPRDATASASVPEVSADAPGRRLGLPPDGKKAPSPSGRQVATGGQ